MSASPIVSPPQAQLSTPVDLVLDEAKYGLDEPETCIVFDWDDTLLASTHLTLAGFRLDTPDELLTADILEQLQLLETAIAGLLKEAMSHGTVYIITNAETGWVQLSAQKFLPGLVPLLSELQILSARSTFESLFPESPSSWKCQAFDYKVKQFYADFHQLKRKNVLSLGDSYAEREAIHKVTQDLHNSRTKSVKFVERPTLEQLRRQIELVTSCFTHIANYDGDLDLDLSLTFPN